MKIEEEILICECNSVEHQIVFRYDEEDNYVYCSMHLAKYNFFKRLVNGIRYIFGYRCRYGDFEEFIFKKEHSKKLRIIADTLDKS